MMLSTQDKNDLILFKVWATSQQQVESWMSLFKEACFSSCMWLFKYWWGCACLHLELPVSGVALTFLPIVLGRWPRGLGLEFVREEGLWPAGRLEWFYQWGSSAQFPASVELELEGNDETHCFCVVVEPISPSSCSPGVLGLFQMKF